jgi:uncharacterized membrane protein YfcA
MALIIGLFVGTVLGLTGAGGSICNFPIYSRNTRIISTKFAS